MRNSLAGLFFIALCVFCSPGQAKAQVTLYTDIVHFNWDGVHNEMVGVAYTLSDYGPTYCSDISVYLTQLQNDEEVSANFNHGGYCNSWVQVETSLPYVEGTDYQVDAEVEATPVYRYENDFSSYDPYGYAYYDWLYVNGVPIQYPFWYNFAGTSFPPRSTLSSFVLGTVFSYLPAGSSERSGPPHHVRVVSDETDDHCGSKRRRIRFQVVDSRGRRAGTIRVRERFYQVVQVPDMYNSCRDERTTPSQCEPTDLGTAGIFGDQLWVGCPLVSGDCGYDEFMSEWSWCPGGNHQEVRLTANRYNVRRDSVLIWGSPRIAPGTELY